jgi:hypothetical protein
MEVLYICVMRLRKVIKDTMVGVGGFGYDRDCWAKAVEGPDRQCLDSNSFLPFENRYIQPG